MKSTAFAVLAAFLLAAGAAAQTDGEPVQPQDSLQVTEEEPVSVSDAPGEESEDGTPDSPAEDGGEVRVPGQPSAVITAFFESLRTGDGYMVSQLISREGLERIEVMLDVLKRNLDDDPDAVMSRLSGAGYTATADEVEDWSPMEYLTATVELPVMKARYSMYSMEIGEYEVRGDRIIVPLTFTMSSGVELPFQAELVKVRNDWRVSDFMGLSSFP